MGMSTMNNKMTTSNNKGVEKGCLKHQKCQVEHEKFSLWRIGATKNVEGNTWACGHQDQKHFIFYIGKHGKKDIGGCWISKRKFVVAAMRGTKKAFFENK